MATKFDQIVVKSIKQADGKTFAVGTKAVKQNDVTKTAAAVNTVFVAPGAIGQAASLADLQAIQTEHNKVVTDLTNLCTRVNALIDIFEAFQQSATS